MDHFDHAGTVIHGTMRDEDIIPALYTKLCELAPAKAATIASDHALGPKGEWVDGDDGFEAGHEATSALFDALDELAPAGWYFGAIEGDGSDFGFWQHDNEED